MAKVSQNFPHHLRHPSLDYCGFLVLVYFDFLVLVYFDFLVLVYCGFLVLVYFDFLVLISFFPNSIFNFILTSNPYSSSYERKTIRLFGVRL